MIETEYRWQYYKVKIFCCHVFYYLWSFCFYSLTWVDILLLKRICVCDFKYRTWRLYLHKILRYVCSVDLLRQCTYSLSYKYTDHHWIDLQWKIWGVEVSAGDPPLLDSISYLYRMSISLEIFQKSNTAKIFRIKMNVFSD